MQALKWQEKQPGLIMAVNFSTIQLMQADIVSSVSATLQELSYPPSLLEIEITESVLIDDQTDAMEKMIAFSKLGIKLVIDDFGTGFSSLSYLSNLPINKLKIDRSFFANPDNKINHVLVKAIILMAQSLAIEVLAEGIETVEQRDFLLKNACFLAQGHYFCQAKKADEITGRYFD